MTARRVANAAAGAVEAAVAAVEATVMKAETPRQAEAPRKVRSRLVSAAGDNSKTSAALRAATASATRAVQAVVLETAGVVAALRTTTTAPSLKAAETAGVVAVLRTTTTAPSLKAAETAGVVAVLRTTTTAPSLKVPETAAAVAGAVDAATTRVARATAANPARTTTSGAAAAATTRTGAVSISVGSELVSVVASARHANRSRVRSPRTSHSVPLMPVVPETSSPLVVADQAASVPPSV
jgi:hypothetical protein